MSRIINGDALTVLQTLPDCSVHCCVTSPPYWGLRDYGVSGQLGLEPTPQEYVAKMVDVFREVRRVLREDGTLWVNIGDSYASLPRGGRKESPGVGATQAIGPIHRAVKWGSGGGTNFHWELPGGIKQKDLIGIPWMLAFALRADGWYLRQDIIWHKPNPMPESVTDRCTKAHEYIFLMAKSARYYYDQEAVKETAIGGCLHGVTDRTKQRGMADTFKRNNSKRGQAMFGQTHGTHREDRTDSTYDLYTRNRRSVWTVATKPFKGAHFATFPPDLIKPCILAGCPEGGIVLDPFFGSGTTGVVAEKFGREYIGIDLNPGYCDMASARIMSA